jgi:hypothetical protein
MTAALCINCGRIKFGAFNPCPNCQTSSTGNFDLDIAFSDHQLSQKALEGLGLVIQRIRKICDDDQVRFWTFLYYISENHSSILSLQEVEPKMKSTAIELLSRIELPQIDMRKEDKGSESVESKDN